MLHLYLMDRFKPLDIKPNEFLELASENLLELFDCIRERVEENTGKIYYVRVRKVMFDVKDLDIVIEYRVNSEAGIVPVKIIYSSRPTRALIKYYRLENKH